MGTIALINWYIHPTITGDIWISAWEVSKTSNIVGQDGGHKWKLLLHQDCSVPLEFARMCRPHQPKRDPELSHLKLSCIGLSQRRCRSHSTVAEGITGAWETGKGIDDELENHILTTSKAQVTWSWKGELGLPSAPRVHQKRRLPYAGAATWNLKVSIQQLHV